MALEGSRSGFPACRRQSITGDKPATSSHVSDRALSRQLIAFLLLIVHFDCATRQADHIIYSRLVDLASRFGRHGSVRQHGISTQRSNMSTSDRIALRHKAIELVGFQTTRLSNKMHRDASQVLGDQATRNIMQIRQLDWHFVDKHAPRNSAGLRL